jgi:hypothetical protein
MYPNGLLLSLAVRASPQAHDGATPSMPLTPNLAAPGLRNVHVHVALTGGAVTTPGAAEVVPPFAPVAVPASALPTSVMTEAPVAPPVHGVPTADAVPAEDAESASPTVVTAIALTPQLEAYVDNRITEDVDAAVAFLRENSLDDMIEECVDAKVSEAMTEHTDTLDALEARIDELEDREPSGIDEDTFEELRLDVDELSEELDQLKGLRETVEALTATCEALTKRVAQLEHAAGGAPHHGETGNEGEG